MAYRASKQRDIIMDYMRQTKTHVSAEQIFSELNTTDKKVSLATVYRNLNILTEMGKIKKIALADGYVYDKTCTPHYHFYCCKCHTLYDLPTAYHEQLNDAIDGSTIIGEIEEHEITFKGICKNCL